MNQRQNSALRIENMLNAMKVVDPSAPAVRLLLSEASLCPRFAVNRPLYDVGQFAIGVWVWILPFDIDRRWSERASSRPPRRLWYKHLEVIGVDMGRVVYIERECSR